MTLVRAALFYLGSMKVADLTEGSATFKSNGELIVTVDEVIKTKGQVTSDMSFKTVVPTTGMKGVDAVQLMIDQVALTVCFSANGKNYNVEGTFDEVTIDTKVQSGAVTGSFKFTGGKPVVA